MFKKEKRIFELKIKLACIAIHLFFLKTMILIRDIEIYLLKKNKCVVIQDKLNTIFKENLNNLNFVIQTKNKAEFKGLMKTLRYWNIPFQRQRIPIKKISKMLLKQFGTNGFWRIVSDENEDVFVEHSITGEYWKHPLFNLKIYSLE